MVKSNRNKAFLDLYFIKKINKKNLSFKVMIKRIFGSSKSF